jgi:hypothetical protein
MHRDKLVFQDMTKAATGKSTETTISFLLWFTNADAKRTRYVLKQELLNNNTDLPV